MEEIIMDEKMMEQATFEGVCRLLKNRKDDGALLRCVVSLAKLLTLVVPGLTFAKPVNMEWFGDILDRGLTLLDSSEHCWDVIKNLGDVLKKEEPDYVKRANNAAIAYVLIVYTAFLMRQKKWLLAQMWILTLTAMQSLLLQKKRGQHCRIGMSCQVRICQDGS